MGRVLNFELLDSIFLRFFFFFLRIVDKKTALKKKYKKKPKHAKRTKKNVRRNLSLVQQKWVTKRKSENK